jgi:hypothetical protein
VRERHRGSGQGHHEGGVLGKGDMSLLGGHWKASVLSSLPTTSAPFSPRLKECLRA